jgi:hypothetical protein
VERKLGLSDFSDGERVIYLPGHANGDVKHPDAEYGVVSSVGCRFVFVRFRQQATAQACDPSDLRKMSEIGK